MAWWLMILAYALGKSAKSRPMRITYRIAEEKPSSNRELFDDFLCAIALLGFIVFALTWGLGGAK